MLEKLTYKKAIRLSLKSHPDFNEKWLQERIAEDPSLLGLGDVEVRNLEVMQPKAGRLDLLLRDPETERRYVVEIQLGATDASHIIRTIEYWDLQRKRYPQYEHCAVLVAEDITSRFLNVIGLFNSTIPIIAIQLNALESEGAILLNSVTVLDLVERPDEDEGTETWGLGADRPYWQSKAGSDTLGVVDACMSMLQSIRAGIVPRYMKHYIGQTEDGFANHRVAFRPRKQWVRAGVRLGDKEAWRQRLADTDIDVLDSKGPRLMIQFTKSVFEQNRPLFQELFKASYEVAGDEE